MKQSICGANCEKCSFMDSCRGCAATRGRPFGGACIAAEYIKTGGAVWTNTRDMLPLLQGMADNCGQDKKMRKVVTRAAKFRIDLLKKMDINSKEPQRQVTVGGVKMTASEFLSNNFQKIIDKLK